MARVRGETETGPSRTWSTVCGTQDLVLAAEHMAGRRASSLGYRWTVTGDISTEALHHGISELARAIPPLPAGSRSPASPRTCVEVVEPRQLPEHAQSLNPTDGTSIDDASLRINLAQVNELTHAVALSAHPARWDAGSGEVFGRLLARVLDRGDAGRYVDLAQRAFRMFCGRERGEARQGDLRGGCRNVLGNAEPVRLWNGTGDLDGEAAPPGVVDLETAGRVAIAGALATMSTAPASVAALSLLTAYVGRWMGRDRVIVTCAVDQRVLMPAFEWAIGPLTDGLAVAAPYEAGASWLDHLQYTEAALTRHMTSLPGPFVRAMAGGPRLDSHWLPTGLGFGFHALPNSASNETVAVRGEPVGPALPLAELHVEFAEAAGDIHVRAVVDRARVRLDHARSFLEGLAAFASDIELRGSPARARLASRSQQQALLRRGTNNSFAAAPNVVERIDAVAGDQPDAPATTYRGTTRSYGDLVSRSRALADRLRASGAASGETVALALPVDDDATVALIAVLRAGAAYVPLDITAPAARLRSQLENLRPAAVVVTDPPDSVVDTVGHLGIPMVTLSPESPSRTSATSDQSARLGADAAYVMFTSGSTGAPKGVMVSHHALGQFVDDVVGRFRISGRDRVLGFARLTFDASVLEQLVGLCAGAHVFIATEDMRSDPSEFESYLRECRVTVAHIPPAVLPYVNPVELPHLRLVMAGGEAYSEDLIAPWTERGKEFWNCYGPTETTVVATMRRCHGSRGHGIPPIGLPRAGHRVYVLDGYQEMYPPGATGELYISGPGVAYGYFHDAGRTAASFLPDPFRADGTRMYRTGDVARWNGDGDLEFVGRADRQVKLRGIRIELEEIEGVLRSHGAVANAAVVASPHGLGFDSVAAFVVANRKVDDSELRQHLADRLPASCMPTSITCVDAFPLNSSGKVDRRELMRVLAEARQLVDRHVTAVERAITTDAVGPLFSSHHAGPDDDLLALGLNVIDVIDLVARTAQLFGVALNPADLLRSPSVAGLATMVERARRSSGPPRSDRISLESLASSL